MSFESIAWGATAAIWVVRLSLKYRAHRRANPPRSILSELAERPSALSPVTLAMFDELGPGRDDADPPTTGVPSRPRSPRGGPAIYARATVAHETVPS